MQCRGVISGLGFRHGMARLPWPQCRPPRGFWEDSNLKPRHTNLGAHFDRHCRQPSLRTCRITWASLRGPGAHHQQATNLLVCISNQTCKAQRFDDKQASAQPAAVDARTTGLHHISIPSHVSERERPSPILNVFSRGINRRTRLCSSTAGSSIRVARLLRVFSSRNRKRASSSRARFILVQSCRPASAHRLHDAVLFTWQ